MDQPYIRKVKFPEGTFDFVNCEIAMFEKDDGGSKNVTSTFHSYIAIGMPGIDMAANISPELKFFDETKIFAYAQDMNELMEWSTNGGWDFIILDYEKEVDFDED